MTTALFKERLMPALAADMRMHGVTRLEIDLPDGERLRLCRPAGNVVIPTHVTDFGLSAETNPLASRAITSGAVGRLVLRDPGTGQPLVQPGQTVDETTILGFVCVDLLLRPIAAPFAGTVEAVLAGNDSEVGYGTPVFSLITEDARISS